MATKKRGGGKSTARKAPATGKKGKGRKAAAKRPAVKRGPSSSALPAELRRQHGTKTSHAIQDHVEQMLAQGSQPATIVESLKSSFGLSGIDATAVIQISLSVS